MKQEYIIVSKTAIEERIEELEKAILLCKPEQRLLKDLLEQEVEIRKQILSQSTPLIPEIKKALKESIPICDEHTLEEAIKIEEDYKKWYISNLKLDI